ncbi:TIGR04104 family putative zinc finger protein [Piscibacillus halophilus]|uniref:Cxxc_20_cxxc protein n=1 Tax=Piscibacillus halophilus TaxID=571933 RepID=A0A1H9GZ91_9BACI|nr:TIGR04104 family putative zinc finger protein [Piscibacillus halophilus]SEQ55313.1 cxxc_20_cxxc protein [Piscibacillus halophilus]
MPKCPHCHQPFMYKQLLRISWSSRVGVECSNCQKTSFESASSKKKLTLVTIITPITIIIFRELLNLSMTVVSFIILMFLGILTLTLPLYTKLTKEEEPLW